MYRTRSHLPLLRRDTGVPQHVVERLLAERDQLARNQQQLAHEVERLRAHRAAPDHRMQQLRTALEQQSRVVDTLRASNQTLLDQVHALQSTVEDAPSDSTRVQELLADVRRVQEKADANRDRAVAAEQARLLGVVADVADDLTRAIATADATIAEGLQAVLLRVTSRLEDAGVTRFGRSGDAFDPTHHEAVATSEEAATGVVQAVVRSGLKTAQDHMLRPARVIVGR